MAGAMGIYVCHKANLGSRFSPIHPPIRFVGIDGWAQLISLRRGGTHCVCATQAMLAWPEN